MKTILFLIVISAVFIILSIGCASNSDRGPEYHYYPEKNLYYDVQKRNFLYSLDGAKTWSSVSSTVQKQPGTLGESVVIYSDSAEVYKNNDAHRKQYAGTLYNIVRNDTTITRTQPEVSERKETILSKPQDVKAKADGKPKKGIGKLLNKIFRKKDKK